MTIKHVNSDASIEELLEIIDHDAGVIIDNVLSQSQLDKITEELNPFLANTKEGQDDFTGFNTRRVGALMARSPECRVLALDPLINDLSKKEILELRRKLNKNILLVIDDAYTEYMKNDDYSCSCLRCIIYIRLFYTCFV